MIHPLMKSARILLLALAPLFTIHAEPWTDPAPPAAVAFSDQSAPEPQAFDRLTFKAAPAPLKQGAKTGDWPRFLGPTDDLRSPETMLLHDLPPTGPAQVWAVSKGEGYTSPAIEGDFLVIFHALN